MSVKFVLPSSTGELQDSVLSRIVSSASILSLTDRANTTDSNVNQVGINFDGDNDHFVLEGDGVLVTDTASPMLGAAPANSTSSRIAFDGWFKVTNTGVARNTIFDLSIQRNKLASDTPANTGFDGIYQVFVTKDASSEAKLEFRISQDFSYSVTGTTVISSASLDDGSPHNHFYVDFSQATSTMIGYLNKNKEFEVSFSAFDGNSNSAVSASHDLYSPGGDTFNGVVDELRLWAQTAGEDAIGVISSVSSIGIDPNKLSSSSDISHDNLIAWWREETTTVGQLVNATPSSILDFAFSASGNLTALTSSTTSLSANWATPSGFQGADQLLSMNTIVSGLSASGALLSAQGAGDILFGGGGTLDHGGLLAINTLDQKVTLEPASEPINSLLYGTWTAIGDATIVDEPFQVWSAASAIKVTINDSLNTIGVKIPISTSALVYNAVPYTSSLRVRAIPRADASIDLTLSAEFEVAGATVTGAIDMDEFVWQPWALTVTAGQDSTTTGELRIFNNSGKISSFYIDGYNLFMSDYRSQFVGPDSIRKGSQLVYHITEEVV